MKLKERVENNVDWRIHLFRGYLEVKRKRSRVYNTWLVTNETLFTLPLLTCCPPGPDALQLCICNSSEKHDDSFIILIYIDKTI